MQLHDIQSKKPTQNRTRIGRGGKRGTYAGRGLNGQKSRAGARIRPDIRDFIKSLPKMKGYRFMSVQHKPAVVNLDFLEKHFDAGQNVTIASLKRRRLVPNVKSVKVLGVGTITKAVKVKGLAVSARATEKITKAGGVISE